MNKVFSERFHRNAFLSVDVPAAVRILQGHTTGASSNLGRVATVEGQGRYLHVGQNDEASRLKVPGHDHQVPDGCVVLEHVQRFDEDRVSVRGRHGKLVHPSTARSDVNNVGLFRVRLNGHDGQLLGHADLDVDGQWGDAGHGLVEQSVVLQEVDTRF